MSPTDPPDPPPDPPDPPDPIAAAKPEPTAKQLIERRAGLDDVIDAATRAELERWFSLPSFADAPAPPKPPPSRDEQAMLHVREVRTAAMAAVDPALLDEIDARRERLANARPLPTPLAVQIDPEIGAVDLAMIDRAFVVGEPRLIDIPEELNEEIKACTPQALLRDLHRLEEEYPWRFEVVDPLAEWKIDVRGLIRTAMTKQPGVPKAGPTPLDEARAMLATLRGLRRIAVADIPFKRRTVKE